MKITNEAYLNVHYQGRENEGESVPVALELINEVVCAEIQDALYNLHENGDEYAADSIIIRLRQGDMSGTVMGNNSMIIFSVQF